MKDITIRGVVAITALAAIAYGAYRHFGDPFVAAGITGAIYLLAEYRR